MMPSHFSPSTEGSFHFYKLCVEQNVGVKCVGNATSEKPFTTYSKHSTASNNRCCMGFTLGRDFSEH